MKPKKMEVIKKIFEFRKRSSFLCLIMLMILSIQKVDLFQVCGDIESHPEAT